MELEGLKRALAMLEERGGGEIDFSHLVTDRHNQVKYYMSRDKRNIIHMMLNVWHVAEGIAFYNKIISIFI